MMVLSNSVAKICKLTASLSNLNYKVLKDLKWKRQYKHVHTWTNKQTKKRRREGDISVSKSLNLIVEMKSVANIEHTQF